MKIMLPPELERLIQRKIESGSHGDASGVIRHALRLMLDQETGGRPAPRKADVVAALKLLEQPLRESGVTSLWLFGSVVRDATAPDSDVDVLIETDPSFDFTLLDLVGVQELIGDALGWEADVGLRESLKEIIREQVLREAEAIF